MATSLARAPVEVPETFIAAAKAQVEKEGRGDDLASAVKSSSLLLFLHAVPASKVWQPGSPLSLSLLDGSFANVLASRLNGEPLQGAGFDVELQNAGLFLAYYVLPGPAQDQKTRDAAIDAEIERCVKNVGGEVTKKKNLSEKDQAIVEVIAKSPKNPKVTIHCRLICAGNRLLALTATTLNEDGGINIDHRPMFDAFRFH